MLTDYHAKYFAYELTKRCASDSLEKLSATLSNAQVDLNPHQIEAALFAFRSPLSKGAILADEVGLGKTIEAGIVISQKWAERQRKILIIVPANLRKQWNEELLDKFFIPSIILEKKSFNEEIKKGNLNPLNQKDLVVICSYHFARSKDVYIKQAGFDLVIIDEAHRLRNVYKESNKIANAIKNSLKDFPKILLTATPLQNSLIELYGLVSVVDEQVFGDLESFKAQYCHSDPPNYAELKERIKPVCLRTLRRQVLEYIKYTNRMAITQEFYPRQEEQDLYNLVTEYLQRDRLYALPKAQRHLMTLILRKLLASSTYAIAGTLLGLARKLEFLLKNQDKPEVVEDVLSQDYEAYEETKDEWIDDEEGDGEEKDEPPQTKLTAEDVENINEEIDLLKQMHELAKSIVKNSKGEVLLTALQKGFEEAQKKGALKKAIIFTESTRTQSYILEILNQTEYANRIVLFNGNNNSPQAREILKKWVEKNKDTDRITDSSTANMRAALVDFFRNEAVIMIATEAAAEGINLQFCSLIVNYDLPWNPQRIEQRIGRCHRYGQKHDVVVVNFLNKKNAADVRVYELLEKKFQLFSGVFGASDEILGALESGVDFERRIAQIYQNCRTEEQIQISFDQLQKDLEENISEKITQTKQRLLESFDEEVAEKLKMNSIQSKEYLGKYEAWLWDLTRYFLEPYARFDQGDHSFTLVKNPFPTESIDPGPYRIGKHIDDAHIYRVGHPLAQKVISQFKSKNLSTVEVQFDYEKSGKKISILEGLVNRTGWLSVYNFTIQSFEEEDHVVLCGLTEDGQELNADQCRRLFSLPGSVMNETVLAENTKIRIKEIIGKRQAMILDANMQRNSGFFDKEIDKLDKWAEDKRNSLKLSLKDLDDEIKELKKTAKQAQSLPDKLAAQKKVKALEKKRDEAWREYDVTGRKVEEDKDNLIESIEKKLTAKETLAEVFTIRWKVV
ncbi:MAG: SNF2-related protein [Candidatus Omnitrophota bacterium]